MKALGLLLVVFGIVGLLWGGFSWTQQEKVVDLGPLEVNKESRRSMPIPPIAGAICLLTGVVVLVTARRG